VTTVTGSNSLSQTTTEDGNPQRTRIRKIAIEEHFAPRAFSHLITNPGWPRATFELVLDQLADIDRRLALMDAADVEVSVLSFGAAGLQDLLEPRAASDLAREINDALAKIVAEHPERFAGFATLPMQDPNAAAAELRRTVEEHGFRGALVNGFSNLGSSDVARYYDLDEYEPFWATVEELQVPFYLHPRNPLSSQCQIYEGRPELLGPTWAFAVETGTHALRLITSGLFDRHPGVTVVLGHLGEFLPFAIHRLEQRMSRRDDVEMTRLPTEVFTQNFYVTTSGNYHTPSLAACIEVMGVDRIMFAADYPFEDLSDGISWFDNLELDPKTKALIGAENARRLFALGAARAD